MKAEDMVFAAGLGLVGYALWRLTRPMCPFRKRDEAPPLPEPEPEPDPAVVDALARILIVETGAQAPTIAEENGIMQVVLNRAAAWGSSPDDVIHNRSLNRHGRPRIWNRSDRFLGNLDRAPSHGNWDVAVRKAEDYLREGTNPIGPRKAFEHVHDGRPIPRWITNGEYPPIRVGRAMFA